MAPRRDSRGAKLQVWLSRSETTEWADVEFQEGLKTTLAKMAAARGRRFVQIFSERGAELAMVSCGGGGAP